MWGGLEPGDEFGSVARMLAAELSARILLQATEVGSLRAFREGVLQLLAEAVPHDVAVFHAFSPRVPLTSAVLRGVTYEAVEATVPRWDAVAVELERLREHALAHGGVVTDDEVFPRGLSARTAFDAAVALPLGVRTIALVHLIVRGHIIAGLLLGRRRRSFDEDDRELLREIAPTLALGDALHAALDNVPRPSLPVELRCADQRLTRRQREIVDLVARGHTTEGIADALGLSPNTLKNHMNRIFERLGAANRADVVRLAVLLPAHSA